MQNPDGTADCDRCGTGLAGYGVLTGMVIADLDGAEVRDQIVCYTNCRDSVLDDLIHHAAGVCTSCGEATRRAVADALLAADLDPDGSGLARQLTFCYANGCAAALLSRL